MAEANAYITSPEHQDALFATITEETLAVERFVKTLSNESIRTIGPELIFGTLFDRIGFNAINDELFRHITIARLAFPVSKAKTTDYLYRYQGITVDVSSIYRFLDRLHNTHKERVEMIAYENTKRILGTITVVFYDMTTLYFETEDEDDLRKMGWSKDGKNECPQIMIGLLIGEGGYPIGYDIFEGNTFEGKTFLPTLKKLQRKYGFTKPVVVADAGLLSKDNIKQLQENDYTFILGGRIKNESATITAAILDRAGKLSDGKTFTLERADGTTLVVSYTNKRARKDAHNRERGISKLRRKVSSGKLTKENISNRGYNKFLTLSGKISVVIDETKVKEDARFDGLKGYITNTSLSSEAVIEHYGHLWQIEKAFRISKTDLRIRPIFHYLRRRIEAHICISFVAYAIWKELELLLRKHGVAMSAKRAGELTQTMYEIKYTKPGEISESRTILKMDDEQTSLYEVIHKK